MPIISNNPPSAVKVFIDSDQGSQKVIATASQTNIAVSGNNLNAEQKIIPQIAPATNKVIIDGGTTINTGNVTQEFYTVNVDSIFCGTF